jgi:histone H3/H4
MVDRRTVLNNFLTDLNDETFQELHAKLESHELCDTYHQLKERIEESFQKFKIKFSKYPDIDFEPENINETRKKLRSEVSRALKQMEKPNKPVKKPVKPSKSNPLAELRKIIKADNAQTSVLMKAPLRLGIRNMAESFRAPQAEQQLPFKFQANAMEILYQVIESHLTTFLSHTHMCTDFASRSTTFPKDIELTKQLMEHNNKVAHNIRMEREKERERVVRR